MPPSLEKIIVGDDEIEFAQKEFPAMPLVTRPEFVADHAELIRRALPGTYSIIITDLNYTPNGQEGFAVLEALKGVTARKILWTGNAGEEYVRERGTALGAEVLGKDELGTIVGIVKSPVPFKRDGDVLVYVPEVAGMTWEDPKGMHKQTGYGAARQLMEQFGERVVLERDSSKLRSLIGTNRFGLIVDVAGYPLVAHEMKYVEVTEAPRVVTVRYDTYPDVLGDKVMTAVQEYFRSTPK